MGVEQNDKGFFIDSLLSLDKKPESSNQESSDNNLTGLFKFYKFLTTTNNEQEPISEESFDDQNEQVNLFKISN